MTREPNSRTRLVATGTLSAAGLVMLALMPSSPTVRPGGAPGWRWLWSVPTSSADPLEALTATARLIAMAALTYLVLITLANLAQSLVPHHRRGSRTMRALQSLTPRWLAVASIGVAIGAGPVAAQQPPSPTDGRAAPVMELLDAGHGHRPSGLAATPSTTGSTEPSPVVVVPRDASRAGGRQSEQGAPSTSRTPTMGRGVAGEPGATVAPAGRPASSMPRADDDTAPMIDPSSPLQPIPEQSPASESTDQSASSGPAVPTTQPSVDQLPPAAAVHRVQPGEHFWSIAEQVVSERVGPGASDAAVAAYWRQLVDVNRERLVDPDNPDLIMPGQVFDLPW